MSLYRFEKKYVPVEKGSQTIKCVRSIKWKCIQTNMIKIE